MSDPCEAALPAVVARLTALHPVDPPSPGRQTADPALLLRAVAARPWRRTALDAATQADIAGKLTDAVAAGRPLEFSLPFGGYRGCRLPGSPHLDWAELFWVDYLRSYATRLARLHAPGVIISLTCLTGLLGWVNNLRPDDQDLYLDELRRLLSLRSSPRVALRLVDLTDLCGGASAALAQMAEREATAPTPTAAQQASAARNLVRFGGVHDLSGLTDAEWQAAIVRSARRCAVMEGLEPRRAFNKFGPRIQLTHVRGASLSLHLGSCRSAVAQPWVSTGFLEWRADQGAWLERLGSGLPAAARPVPVRHDLLSLSPLLSTIPVVVT